jgi:hypothetical protein
MKTSRIIVLIGILVITIASLEIISCSKTKSNSRLTVYLTDAPAGYDAVNIDVAKLEIKSTSDTGSNGWQELPITPGVYNLLDFRNGMDMLLSSVELPAGLVSQMRLVLGNNNTIEVNGNSMPLPLQTPSAQTSGLKFNIHATLVEGVDYKIWIDFDAARSVVVTGGTDYILKPVVRTFTEATSGAIKGNVQPQAADATMYAIQGTDSISAMPDVSGNYLIRGVPVGIWSVVAHGDNGYNDQTFNNISVLLGKVTVMDSITLIQ